MKKLFAVFVLCALCFLSSCIAFLPQENPEAIAEFSQYQSAGTVAVTFDREHIYFNTHTLHLGDVVQGEDINGTPLLKKDKIIFSTTKPAGLFDFTLRVYECDQYGNGLHLLFEKEGFETYS